MSSYLWIIIYKKDKELFAMRVVPLYWMKRVTRLNNIFIKNRLPTRLASLT